MDVQYRSIKVVLEDHGKQPKGSKYIRRLKIQVYLECLKNTHVPCWETRKIGTRYWVWKCMEYYVRLSPPVGTLAAGTAGTRSDQSCRCDANFHTVMQWFTADLANLAKLCSKVAQMPFVVHPWLWMLRKAVQGCGLSGCNMIQKWIGCGHVKQLLYIALPCLCATHCLWVQKAEFKQWQ